MRRTKRTHVVTVVAGIVFSVAMIVGLMFFAGFWRTGSSYTVSTLVYNARGIAADSTVFEAGLPVGLVTGVQRKGPDAILTLRIDSGPTPIPVDSKIQLGLRSLAGEADVLLSLGQSGQMVRNGGSLGLSQDQSYTEVDQILNQFAGPTEGRARQFFQGVGAGVQGEGQNLNQTLGGFATLVNNSPPLTATLASQHSQVADIVQNFGNIMGAIGQRSQALDEFARGALTTFNDVAGRDAAMRSILKQLPFVVGGNWAAVKSVRANAPSIIPLVNSLASTTLKLQPALDVLPSASSSGVNVVRALGGASPALKSLLVNLEKLQPSAARALPAVHAITCQVDPMARFIAPYGRDIMEFFQSFGAATGVYETNAAHQLIASLLVDPASFFRGVQTQPNVNNLLTTLLNFGVFQKAGGTGGFHAIVPPGHIADASIGANASGPIQFGATHQYPHVTADCVK
jgi:phospholipid/cholesterol/gamma-HCH transport system substrate-binding protein